MPRLIVIFGGAFAALFLLAGCSFRPLYAKTGNDVSVTSNLSGISVLEQTNRSGQRVRNELMSGFGTDGGPGRYLLKLDVRDAKAQVSSLSGTHVRRFRDQLTASYTLVNAADGKVLTTGRSLSVVQYDVLDEPVADMQAEENAGMRAAREVAQDIRVKLAAFFSESAG